MAFRVSLFLSQFWLKREEIGRFLFPKREKNSVRHYLRRFMIVTVLAMDKLQRSPPLHGNLETACCCVLHLECPQWSPLESSNFEWTFFCFERSLVWTFSFSKREPFAAQRHYGYADSSDSEELESVRKKPSATRRQWHYCTQKKVRTAIHCRPQRRAWSTRELSIRELFQWIPNLFWPVWKIYVSPNKSYGES